MKSCDSSKLARLDQRYVWHPFTQMRDWLKREPILIAGGQGAVLRDSRGREYLDANASIWTNLHGHNHPQINTAINRQLRKIAHSSALGLANEPAALLAEKLVQAARLRNHTAEIATFNRANHLQPRLEKVFFSDDGSTAMEVALKLAYEFARRTERSPRPRFLSLASAYHGDTVGAVALGHIDLFHKAYAGLLFRSDQVMAPYCYRCPFNRARPERADARDYRQCKWECLAKLEGKFARQRKKGNSYAGFVFEPLVQGAAGMIAQPAGWLRRAAEIARGHGALLIADEVMTGFGRTGFAPDSSPGALERPGRPSPAAAGPRLFASHKEGVQPDFMALAKGLTGGYLPMAATLTTREVFDAFLGEYEQCKTFFHGHSFTGNQLAASAALASLDLLQRSDCRRHCLNLEQVMREQLRTLWRHPHIGDIRQVGLVAGIELVKDWRHREPFAWQARAGIRVCEATARRGVLTRPVGNVIVLMPPYCSSPPQIQRMVEAVGDAVRVLRHT